MSRHCTSQHPSDATTSAASNHTPLDNSRHEIRILTVFAGKYRSTVKCKLHKKDFQHAGSYTALSYTWGDPANTARIIVNGNPITVPANLESALKRLRHKGITRVWADALCINQQDVEEKSRHVHLMRQIYTNAEQTFAWLGEPESDEDTTQLAIGLLYRVDTKFVIPGGVENPCTCGFGTTKEPINQGHPNRSQRRQGVGEPCQSCIVRLVCLQVVELMTQGYWRRRWIVQEIALARRVLLGRGQVTVDLDELAIAMDHCLRSRYWPFGTNLADSYMQEVLECRKQIQSGHTPSLCAAVLQTQNFLSRSTCDRLFSVIGMCDDSRDLVPDPRYDDKVVHIQTDFIRRLISRNACFDFLLVDDRKRRRTDMLPSWVPSVLTKSVPRQTSFIADMEPFVHMSFADQSLLGHSSTLRLQGVTIGFIIDATTVLTKTATALPETQTSAAASRIEMAKTNMKSPGKYYDSPAHLRGAILSGLMSEQFSTTSRFRLGDSLSLHRYHQLFQLDPKSSDSYLWRRVEWLDRNQEAMVDGKPLWNWLFEDPVTFLWYEITKPLKGRRLLVIQIIFFIACPLVVIYIMLKQKASVSWALTIATTITEAMRWLIDQDNEDDHILQQAQMRTLTPRRLTVLNSGIIGQSSRFSRVGDQVCLLAGFSTAVVLRPCTGREDGLYRLVGRASAYLNDSDGRRYEYFNRPQTLAEIEKLEERKQGLLDARQWPDWQDFVLV